MKREEPQTSAKDQNQQVEPENQNRILLICDFAGNIGTCWKYLVFWKGDPKVFDLSSSQYLSKNILSFNFTLFSRLKLAAYLTMDLFKQNQRKSFELEIIKKNHKKPLKSNKKLKSTQTPNLQYFLNSIKILKVSASFIQAHFSKMNKVGDMCELQILRKSEKKSDSKKQKLLMVQIEAVSKDKDTLKSEFLKNRKMKEIKKRLFDIEFMKEKKIKMSSLQGKDEKGSGNNTWNDCMKDFDFDYESSERKRISGLKRDAEFLNKIEEFRSDQKERGFGRDQKERGFRVYKSKQELKKEEWLFLRRVEKK